MPHISTIALYTMSSFGPHIYPVSPFVQVYFAQNCSGAVSGPDSAFACFGAPNVNSPKKDRTNIDFLKRFFIFLSILFVSTLVVLAILRFPCCMALQHRGWLGRNRGVFRSGVSWALCFHGANLRNVLVLSSIEETVFQKTHNLESLQTSGA